MVIHLVGVNTNLELSDHNAFSLNHFTVLLNHTFIETLLAHINTYWIPFSVYQFLLLSLSEASLISMFLANRLFHCNHINIISARQTVGTA